MIYILATYRKIQTHQVLSSKRLEPLLGMPPNLRDVKGSHLLLQLKRVYLPFLGVLAKKMKTPGPLEMANNSTLASK